MKKMSRDVANTLIEIVHYCEANKIISYYDTKAYAYREKPEWIPVFTCKQSRICLAEYLRSMKRKYKLKYDKPAFNAMSECLDCMIEEATKNE